MKYPTEDKYQDIVMNYPTPSSDVVNEAYGLNEDKLKTLLDSTKEVEVKTVEQGVQDIIFRLQTAKDLYILDGHKEENGVVTFTGEASNKILFNVQFAISDFEAYFEAENIDLDQFEDLHHHAQEIYDAWEKGGTYYEVSVSVK